MASGSPAGRANSSGAKSGFVFASDDILCSYEDYVNQEASNGSHSDPVIGSSSSKDFHKNKMPRSSAFPTTKVYAQPEDSFNEEVVVAVERTMKKYNDNLMRFLEGISSRLSQLELYCYNLDKSIGEMRSELQHDHNEADAKLKSADKHLQEVHRSVQILRDKQELANTQKELAKLHLARKESSHSQDDKVTTPGSANTKTDDSPDMHHNLQLALALPNQVPEQQQSITAAPPSQMPTQPMTQQAPYYLPATQLPNPSAQHQPQPPQSISNDSQYRAPQLVQNPSQGQINQSAQAQQFTQYQQQWPQQVHQHPVQPLQPQTQIRVNPSTVYYIPSQPANAPLDALTSPMPMQVPLPGFPHQAVSRAEVMSFGPGGPLQTQPPPQHIKTGNGYSAPGAHTPISSVGSYMVYESDGNRAPHSPPIHFTQGGYHHQANTQLQPSASLVLRGPGPQPQFLRTHPYNEVIDKLTSMGYRGDHVASIIQRLEETGQPVDFNGVLDRLNGHSSGGSQRSW